MRLGLISSGKKFFHNLMHHIFYFFVFLQLYPFPELDASDNFPNKPQPKGKNVKHFTGRQNTVTAEADHTYCNSKKKTVGCTKDTSR